MVARALKCVLYWMSWIWCLYETAVLRVASLILLSLTGALGVSWVEILMDAPLHIRLEVTGVVTEIRALSCERYVATLDCILWCMEVNGTVVILNDTLQ